MFGSETTRRRSGHNAILLGLTDLFVGASAVALIMIVMAKQITQPVRIAQTTLVAHCPPEGGGLLLSGRRGEHPWTLALGALDDLPRQLDQTRLTARVTVATPPEDPSCFWRVKAAVDRYNSGLGSREQAPGPVVILDWGPELTPTPPGARP